MEESASIAALKKLSKAIAARFNVPQCTPGQAVQTFICALAFTDEELGERRHERALQNTSLGDALVSNGAERARISLRFGEQAPKTVFPLTQQDWDALCHNYGAGPEHDVRAHRSMTTRVDTRNECVHLDRVDLRLSALCTNETGAAPHDAFWLYTTAFAGAERRLGLCNAIAARRSAPAELDVDEFCSKLMALQDDVVGTKSRPVALQQLTLVTAKSRFGSEAIASRVAASTTGQTVPTRTRGVPQLRVAPLAEPVCGGLTLRGADELDEPHDVSVKAFSRAVNFSPCVTADAQCAAYIFAGMRCSQAAIETLPLDHEQIGRVCDYAQLSHRPQHDGEVFPHMVRATVSKPGLQRRYADRQLLMRTVNQFVRDVLGEQCADTRQLFADRVAMWVFANSVAAQSPSELIASVRGSSLTSEQEAALSRYLSDPTTAPSPQVMRAFQSVYLQNV